MTNITGDGRSFSSRTNTGEDEVHQHHEQQQLHHHILDTVSAAGANGGFSTSQLLPPPIKKKRNLPGTPDPTAEVIALSPKTLMATNRFICEICHKGFQREQNLQLHRRCHNLPWKLRPRTSTESRKRVYVCPELTCVHHNPSRALGDLTGIKKHYCRKHGEKKWNCNKCSKKYAVQSDWKAHSKICGTREYKCDCGTIFSRRERFITHRVFCDALVQENKLNQPLMAIMASNLMMPINTNASSMELSNLSHDDMKSPPFRTYSNNLSPESFRPSGVAETLYNPRTIPSSSFQLSSGSGPMGFHELGATAGKNSITSVMAGPYRAYGSRPYSPMKAHGLFDHIRSQGKQPQLVGINGGIAGQFYDPSVNHIGLFTTVGTSMSGRDGVVTTVDFLGVGGERSLHWQKQQEAMEYGGIGHGPSLEVFPSFKH